MQASQIILTRSATPVVHTVARTILAQLGGNKILAMTGVKALTSENALTLHLPRGKFFRVTLNDRDLYDIEVGRNATPLQMLKGAASFKITATASDVYGDRLVANFESMTGLYASL